MKPVKTYHIVIGLMLISLSAWAQSLPYKAVYPIGKNPSIGYKTSMVPSTENILFEANPFLRMAFYNNIHEHLQDGEERASTLYFDFRPQVRMYDDNSKPIKMPSYKIGLGYQQIISVGNDNFFAWALESGHYSNGQSKCAFDKNLDDGSPACTDLCYAIANNPDSNLTELLNRESGNFSTNFTEVFLNYRMTILDDNTVPKSSCSFTAGYTLFHNNLFFMAPIGGYSDTDIEIYGRHRFSAGGQFMRRFSKDSWWQNHSLDRYAFSVNTEYISKPHPWVKPGRVEATAILYFENDFGLFVSGVAGHDNYNYRFVDHGVQLFVGLTFDVFPPIEMKGAAD